MKLSKPDIQIIWVATKCGNNVLDHCAQIKYNPLYTVPVSQLTCETWERWHTELSLQCGHLIPRHYFYNLGDIIGMELHGFSDASELAYSGVVYLKSTNDDGAVHTSIVIAKTKVSPIKCITVP